MININLLPDEFRVKESVNVAPKLRIGAIAIGLIFVCVTIFLYTDYLSLSGKVKNYESEWGGKQAEFNRLTQLRSEIEGPLKQDQNFMQSFVTSDRYLTHILSWLSEYLPETSWLTSVQLTRNEQVGKLLIRGLVVPSKDKSSIEHIEIYMQQLKEKLENSQLSLRTTRQTYEDISMTQFIAEFSWVTGVK